MSYATLQELKAWIDIPSTDGDDDALLEPILDGATRMIDRMCSRHFTKETAATKLYYPNALWSMDVVDLISITSLKSDAHGDRSYTTTFATTDYELLPYVDESGRPTVRFQKIMIWPTTSKSFTTGRLVQVVGDFGYVDENGATPLDVRQACLILAARLWKRHEMPTGTLAIPDIGTVERISKTDPDVEALLKPYIRANSWVAV